MMKVVFVLSFCLALASALREPVDFHRKQSSFVKLKPAAEITSPLTKLVKPKPQSGILCEVCKLIVGFVEGDLAKNATVNDIVTFLDTKVCTLFPAFLRPECNATVDKYAPELAQFIEQKLPAPVVCAKVGLCSSLNKLKPLTPLVFKAPEEPKPESGILCEVCKLIVGFVESELGNNKTVAKIEQFLEDDVCKFFPSFLRPECNSTVAEYAPILAHYIEQKLPAPVVCSKVGLCSSSAPEQQQLTPLTALRPAALELTPLTALRPAAVEKLTPLTPLVKPESGILCEVCKLIVGFVESELGNNKTVAKIEQFLEDDVCKFFPSFLRPECNSTVAEYAPILAHYIEQKLPAPVVCSKVGLCSSSAPEQQQLTPLTALRPALVQELDVDEEEEDVVEISRELLRSMLPISEFQDDEE